MWSDAPRSVGSVGTTNRMVVPMTVMVRICLVNSHSPIGADASGSVDSIDTGGCVARLGEHECAKCNHDGEHRCAILGKAQLSVFHFGYLPIRGVRIVSSLRCNENPGHDDRGFCPYSISRCREMHHLRWETRRCGLSIADALISCDKYRQINYQLPNEVILRSTLPRAICRLRRRRSSMTVRSTDRHRSSHPAMR
jgi:hypothetical protein